MENETLMFDDGKKLDTGRTVEEKRNFNDGKAFDAFEQLEAYSSRKYEDHIRYIKEAFPHYVLNENFIGKDKNGNSVKGLIGEGGFGCVYACKDKDMLYDARAVKVIDQDTAHQIDKEFKLQHKFGGNVAVQLFGHRVVKTPAGQEIHLVSMEQMNGTLKDVLKKKNKKLDPVEAVRIMGKVCKIVKKVHDKDCTHGDIKPENILYKIDEDGIITYKLGDFGCSRETDETCSHWSGTDDYCLDHNEWDSPRDIYALSVTLMELLGVNIHDKEDSWRKYKPEELWEDEPVDLDLRKVARKACSIKPSDRYDIREFDAEMKGWLDSHEDEVAIFDKDGDGLFQYACTLEDPARKMKFFQASAGKGNGHASYELSRMYGADLQTYSKEKVMNELERSVSLDYKPAMNDYAVAVIKQMGADGDQEELLKMAELLRQSSDEVPQSAYNLALLIVGGVVPEELPDEIKTLLTAASAKGYEPAAKLLEQL